MIGMISAITWTCIARLCYASSETYKALFTFLSTICHIDQSGTPLLGWRRVWKHSKESTDGFFSSRLLPHSAIPPCLAFFSTRPTPFALTMTNSINKQRDTSFEFSSILSTVYLSKHFIMAWIIRKFIQLVNFVTFRVSFFFSAIEYGKPVRAGTFGKWATFSKEISISTGSFYLVHARIYSM